MNKEKLTELVYINLGRASMCWSEIPRGVFDSTKVAELGKEIMDTVEKYVEEDKEPGWSDPLADYLEEEIAKYKDVPTVVVNQESEWQRRKRLDVIKEVKKTKAAQEMAEVEEVVAGQDFTGRDEAGNPTFRHKGIYYTLDKDFKKILEKKIQRPEGFYPKTW
jgi:hypothetical protein